MPGRTPGRLLGSDKQAEVFEYGEGVLKLYRAPASKAAAFREAAALAEVETLDLPVPRVGAVGEFGGRWGLAMTRADGRSFAEQMQDGPAAMAACLADMVRLQRQIHARPATAFPALRSRLRANIERAPTLGAARQRRLLERLEALPDGKQLCHGDFHPWNIIGSPGAATVVDWLDATRGNPDADVCRSYVLMRHPAPAFADAYLAAFAERRPEILAFLPVIAAARLAENVPGETEGLTTMADAL